MERYGILGDVHYICSARSLKGASSVHLKSYYEAFLEYLSRDAHAVRVLSVGDIAHTGQKSEFFEFYDLVRAKHIKLSHVMGNHDLLSYRKDELEGLEYYIRDRLIQEDNCDILYLDTAKERREDDWGGILTSSQMELLEKSVTESGERTLLIVAHHPVYGTTYGSTDYLMSVKADKRINEILEQKRGKGIFICGHTHLSSMVRRGNWLFVQAASIMNMNVIPMIELDHGNVEVQWVPVKDQWLRETGYRIGSNLKGYTYLSDEHLGRGEERMIWV